VYRLNTPLQWALVAAAGVASFALAIQWRPFQKASEPALVGLVAPDNRPSSVEKGSSVGAAPRQPDFTLALPDRSHAVPQSGGDAMARLSWVAPAPTTLARPVVQAPPPAPELPVAPPLPFTFVGLMEQGVPKPQAFLAKGNALLVVTAGDVIDGDTYRVDSLSSQQIQLTYLPLNTPQTLNILGANK
jgi:hypothetical protein